MVKVVGRARNRIGQSLQALKEHSDNNPEQPWLRPSKLLEDVVESGANIKEELYFRRMNNRK